MTNTMKRILSLVLALVMVFGAMPMQAFAADTEHLTDADPAVDTHQEDTYTPPRG